jgi:signal transduction histidine kinase
VLLSVQCEADVPNGCGDVVAGSGLGMLRSRAQRLGGSLELVARDARLAVLRVDLPAP